MSTLNMPAARDAAFAIGIGEDRSAAHQAAGFDELVEFVDRWDAIPMFVSRSVTIGYLALT
jgi:hypothetical protein